MKGEYKLEFYTVLNLHYWRVTAANNEVIGRSEQGFISEQGAKDNFSLLISLGES